MTVSDDFHDSPNGSAVATRHGPLSELSRRSWSQVFYWFVLAVAAAVDAATFYQVVALVMRNVESWVVWVVVGGFTVLALSLAHSSGSQARHRAEKHFPAVTSATAWLMLLAWLLMGVAAFLVRYVAPTLSAYGFTYDDGSGTGGGSTTLSAVMFLTLYFATGAVAWLAGYRRPHPAIVHFRHAKRAETRAVKRLARSRYKLHSTEVLVKELEALKRRREDALQNALSRTDHLADRLKIEARLMAQEGRRGGFGASWRSPRRSPDL